MNWPGSGGYESPITPRQVAAIFQAAYEQGQRSRDKELMQAQQQVGQLKYRVRDLEKKLEEA